MKLAVIHFHPLEMYPPVMNFINFLDGHKSDIATIKVYSTINILTKETYNPITESCITISRTPHPGASKFKLIRFLLLLRFNIITLIGLIRLKPDLIIYYETFSALPVYLYLHYFSFRAKPKLFIHYHEFTTPEEYANMPAWVKYNYNIEKKYLWNKAEKISHTNKYRKDIFERTEKIDKSKLLIVPNYPPNNWAMHQNSKKTNLPVKIIYIGSLSFEDTYIKEFTEWVISKGNDIQFDIFSYNHKPDIKTFFTENKFSNIQFHPNGIYYYNLPILLKQYQVGVILYKAKTVNVTYCASNKLFEYIACGLDTWVTNEMVGSRPYVTKDIYPKINMVDFKNMYNFNLHSAISIDKMIFKPSDYYCEPVYSELLNLMVYAKR